MKNNWLTLLSSGAIGGFKWNGFTMTSSPTIPHGRRGHSGVPAARRAKHKRANIRKHPHCTARRDGGL